MALCQKITCTGVRGYEEGDQFIQIPSALFAAARLGPGSGQRGMMMPQQNPTTHGNFRHSSDNHDLHVATSYLNRFDAARTGTGTGGFTRGMGEGATLSSFIAGQNTSTFQSGNMEFMRPEMLRSSSLLADPGNAMQNLRLRRIEQQLETGLGGTKTPQLEQMMQDRGMTIAQASRFLLDNNRTMFPLPTPGNLVINQGRVFPQSSSMHTRMNGELGRMPTMPSQHYLGAQQRQMLMQQQQPQTPISMVQMMPSMLMMNQMDQNRGTNRLQQYPLSLDAQQDPMSSTKSSGRQHRAV